MNKQTILQELRENPDKSIKELAWLLSITPKEITEAQLFWNRIHIKRDSDKWNDIKGIKP